MINFGYNGHCHSLEERGLSEYKTRSWAKAATPPANLCNDQPLPRLLQSESEISEQASRKVATEETNKAL